MVYIYQDISQQLSFVEHFLYLKLLLNLLYLRFKQTVCTTILLLFLQAVIEFPSVALGAELDLLLKIFVHSVRVGKPFLKLKTLLILKKIKKKIKFRALEAYVF